MSNGTSKDASSAQASSTSPQQPSQSRNPSDLQFTDVDLLRRYVTDTGKILPRRITGLTAKQQRHMTKMIKRARNLLLLK